MRGRPAAILDWSVRPDAWDEEDIILAYYLPLKRLILAASFRNPVQLTECLLAGADILTVPANVLATVADHPLSDEGMKSFIEDAKAFGK